jgi:hypothetical protein
MRTDGAIAPDRPTAGTPQAGRGAPALEFALRLAVRRRWRRDEEEAASASRPRSAQPPEWLARATTPSVSDARCSTLERVERLATLAAAAGDASPRHLDATVELACGDVVEIAVRAVAREVEIRVSAPLAAASAIASGRSSLLRRLERRGIRVRTCAVVTVGGGRRA